MISIGIHVPIPAPYRSLTAQSVASEPDRTTAEHRFCPFLIIFCRWGQGSSPLMLIALVKTGIPQLEPCCDVSHPYRRTFLSDFFIYDVSIFSEKVSSSIIFKTFFQVGHLFFDSLIYFCYYILSSSHDGRIHNTAETSGIMPPPRSIQDLRFWFGYEWPGVWIWL